jgi:hypothetical protein
MVTSHHQINVLSLSKATRFLRIAMSEQCERRELLVLKQINNLGGHIGSNGNS